MNQLKFVLNYVLWFLLVLWNTPFLLIVLLMSLIRNDTTYIMLVSSKFYDIWHALNGVDSHID